MYTKVNVFIFLFLFIAPKSLEANYPYYRFDTRNLKLSKPSYHKYVRPQIKNIIADYFHIMKKIEPAEQDLISIRKKSQKMNDYWDLWTTQCGKNQSEKCHGYLSSLYKESRALDNVILSFQNQRLRIKNFGKTKILDTVLHLSSAIDNISSVNYIILHFTEETLMTDTTSYQASNVKKAKITLLLQDMLVSSELILSALISPDFRMVFDQVWYGFIKPLERQILSAPDPKYLLSHLGDLNMSWNAFHMKVAKSEKRMKKSELQVVQIMHNRWNSILKVLLRKKF
jgi:hypothetical protein